MRVAVTGAAGLLGRAAVPVLRGLGHEVIALGRDAVRLRERLGNGAACRATSYAEDDLREALEGCGAVVHLAARRIAPPEEGAAAFVGPNVELTGKLLRSASGAGVEAVVLASSISVYSAANALPYTESQEPVPAGHYGRSKVAAERLGGEWAAQTGRRLVALRLASLIGSGDETGRRLMLSVFLERARRGKPLVVWGEGGGGRDLLYVRDAALAVAAALAPGAPGGVYNVGSGRPVRLREVAETVNEVFANPGGIRVDPDRSEDRTVGFMDCAKAKASLGWAPRWTLRTALEDLRDGGDSPARP